MAGRSRASGGERRTIVVRVVVVWGGTSFLARAGRLLAAEPARRVVGDTDDPERAAALVRRVGAEVVLADAEALGDRAPAWLEEMARRAPEVAVILLSLDGVEVDGTGPGEW
jgi:DNA-binding NarL/FixJ family response regulator